MTDNINTPVTEAELIARSEYPRVTKEQLDANISHEMFLHIDGTMLTICVLKLANGFTVVGESACAVPENYKKDVGERLAKSDAIGKIWPLMGYALKEKVALVEQANPPSNPQMKTYVGTKVIHAIPMNLGDYNTYRGWVIPNNEDPAREGFLVEYATDGYQSWSPKEVFEEAYRDLTGAATTKGANTYLSRMEEELDALVVKKRGLKKFISDTNPDAPFLSLVPAEQARLTKQHDVMHEYAGILYDRINFAKQV